MKGIGLHWRSIVALVVCKVMELTDKQKQAVEQVRTYSNFNVHGVEPICITMCPLGTCASFRCTWATGLSIKSSGPMVQHL